MLILKSVNFEQRQFQHHHLEQTYPGQTEWRIGRSVTCDLTLSSPEVSRVHGHITYDDDAYYFIDLGSSSGSLLNGNSVLTHNRYPLQTGDLLQLGETFLHVETLIPPALDSAQENTLRHTAVSLPEQPWTNEDLLCRCCRIVDETADVKTFYFVADSAVLFHYLPGQFVNIEIEIDGQSVMRSYSISSSSTRPYHLSLTIKRVSSPASQPDLPAGLVSNWLHDHFKVGDRIKIIGGAMGSFTCLPNLPSKLLLISAGSGITPMMSMTRWIQDSLVDCDMIFLHSARTSEDIVCRAELEAIAAQMSNFHLAITLTQQPLGRSWMGLTGRISESMLTLIAPDFRDRAIYVCGPEPFMQTIQSMLETMQFPMQQYQQESFGRPLPKSSISQSIADTVSHSQPPTIALFDDIQHDNSFSQENGQVGNDSSIAQPLSVQNSSAIHFIQSGQAVQVEPGVSILEVAEQEGISIRHACRAGACGACKVRVHRGEVRYDTPPPALTAADQQAGYALACVAYPVEQVEIEA